VCVFVIINRYCVVCMSRTKKTRSREFGVKRVVLVLLLLVVVRGVINYYCNYTVINTIEGKRESKI